MKLEIFGIQIEDLYTVIKTIKTLDKLNIEIRPGVSNIDYIIARSSFWSREKINHFYEEFEAYDIHTVQSLKNEKLKVYLSRLLND